ncbi:hypothetical protein PRZ48_011673 [Zasmidium cellare]|uniref:BTB domain-containing protein n=1 Tax=Zasmidium cellare TaxID=395010 RepID=A0ABR0E707_ZASCE|nr:hypothetical protein PRZ48_011673 [Zasmidium cellare]
MASSRSLFGPSTGAASIFSGPTPPQYKLGVKSDAFSTALAAASSFPGAQHVHDPRLPLSRDVDTSGGVVTCRVDSATFIVHRAVLDKSSEFLKTLASLDSESALLLPHQNTEAFALYSKWLYTSAIISTPKDGGDSSTSKDTAEWKVLAKAYVLGEELIDVDFKDTVIDALRAKFKSKEGGTVWEVAADLVRIIYGGTSADSTARRFMADLYHGYALASTFEERSLPSDFLFDLARVGLTRVLKNQMSCARCEYHEHGADKACYLDRRG